MKPGLLRRGMNFWPPFLFSGVRIADESLVARVRRTVHVRRGPRFRPDVEALA